MYLPKTEYYELPKKYNKTIVRLLVQSPTRMFVYWNVSDDTISNVFEKNHINYSEAIPILKITNITMNYSYEIPIDPFANNYYIEVKDPNCRYQVELGRKSKNKFVNIYTSNQVQIPRSMPVATSNQEEVIYKNYIRLDMTDKFIVYYKKPQYNLNGSNPQDYTKLALSTENALINEASDVKIINEGSFSRYENGVSSLENMSSFNNYDMNNISSITRYEN